MMSREKDVTKIDDFQAVQFPVVLWYSRFSIKIDDLASNFTKSLCLVSLRPAETSLIVWFFEKRFHGGLRA